MAERASVVVASTRAATGVYDDRSGPLIVAALQEWGFDVDSVVVPDGEPVREAMVAALGRGARVLLTTGGTGLSPTDHTADITRELLDHEVPGIAEAIRARGVANGVPTAALSRGTAGVRDRCLVVNLPGSTGGVRDGLAVLAEIVPHAVDQLLGGDH